MASNQEHQAVPETIQAKLTIGQPDDKYEQEADSMADQVVQRLKTPTIQQKMCRLRARRKARGSTRRVARGDDEADIR